MTSIQLFMSADAWAEEAEYLARVEGPRARGVAWARTETRDVRLLARKALARELERPVWTARQERR